MELKILQLALAKIAQLGSHETVNTSEHYSPRVAAGSRGNFLLNCQNDPVTESSVV